MTLFAARLPVSSIYSTLGWERSGFVFKDSCENSSLSDIRLAKKASSLFQQRRN